MKILDIIDKHPLETYDYSHSFWNISKGEKEGYGYIAFVNDFESLEKSTLCSAPQINFLSLCLLIEKKYAEFFKIECIEAGRLFFNPIFEDYKNLKGFRLFESFVNGRINLTVRNLKDEKLRFKCVMLGKVSY